MANAIFKEVCGGPYGLPRWAMVEARSLNFTPTTTVGFWPAVGWAMEESGPFWAMEHTQLISVCSWGDFSPTSMKVEKDGEVTFLSPYPVAATWGKIAPPGTLKKLGVKQVLGATEYLLKTGAKAKYRNGRWRVESYHYRQDDIREENLFR